MTCTLLLFPDAGPLSIVQTERKGTKSVREENKYISSFSGTVQIITMTEKKKKKKEIKNHYLRSPVSTSELCLDVVLASEHVIDLCQVVCTWHQVFGAANRRVVLLQMSTLSEDAHLEYRKESQSSVQTSAHKTSITYLIIFLRGYRPPGIEPIVQVEILHDQ
jgi:hypothetical protein